MKPKAEKWQADNGDWCCTIWYPFDEDTPDSGPCFDFPASDIDAVIALLQELKLALFSEQGRQEQNAVKSH